MEFGGIDTSTLTVVAPLVAIGAVVVALLLRTTRQRGRRAAAAAWPSTPGTVLMSTIQIRRTGTTQHEVPVVVYSYTVSQQMYQGNRIRVGDELGSISVRGTVSSAAHIVQRYPVGSMVKVFFDPTNPSLSALER